MKSFDGIIGDDTLKELGALIDRKHNELIITPDIHIPLKEKPSCQVNNIEVRDGHLSPDTKKILHTVISKFTMLFGPVNNFETIDTEVFAEIKTTSEEPIYTKSYPYPYNMRQEVDKQIAQLLADGIIRPSKSPYNSPIWVVEKKLDASQIKKYRMVVDFKRLNSVTVADSYPIPDISNTIANLGDSKFFTTIDLTSGFHQIKMKEADIPKTSFSTMNGKFEFLRLPFGLKNAPAIFQRMIDNVLKEFIGELCYVYIDDIIIFGGRTAEEHLENVEKVFAKLQKAKLRVNLDKTEFLKTETEFLGYLITNKGIKPDQKKVQAIRNIKKPENLKDLKSFLGLASYYRRFIRDFALVAKPLTNLTRGESAQIKASQSKKVKIDLNQKELEAFRNIKELLSSTEILIFPNFDKPFLLTTDASSSAIGAVLSQGEIGKDRPITYISRSLNKTEENYAANEKEMLAIIWALDNLRNYLYGARKIKILTDHQPLTFTLSNRNNNAKLKRWKARLEEYNYELIYKPGPTNKVADALSRLELEANTLSTNGTIHSAEEDSTDVVRYCDAPINVFRNQLIFQNGQDIYVYEEPHPTYHRHYISRPELNKEILSKVLRERLHPTIINGIKIPEEYIQLLHEVFKESFSNYKIRITQRIVEDIRNEENKFSIIKEEHKRAHRNHMENRKQILERYYFPRMASLIRKYTQTCEICNTNKYDRHPYRVALQQTPIPTYPAEILHIDIMEIKNENFLSCVDKFSKFAKFFRIKNKSIMHVRDKIIKAIHYFTAPRILVMDNERSFVSPVVTDYLKTLGIQIYLTPSQRSEVNGAIERVHSTILEVVRCLQNEYRELSIKELINIAVDRYNDSIHSVTQQKPNEIFFGRIQRTNYQNLIDFKTKIHEDLIERLRKNQDATITRENSKRVDPKTYEPGDTIYTAVKQIQRKDKPRFRQETVAQDNNVTVTTTSGRRIHKTQIKNLPQ